jgi:hypothetical protein
MMRRIVGIVLLLVLATNAFGVTGSEVAYIGGSVSGLKAGDVGSFDVSSATELVFTSNGERFPIAYDKIKKIEYRNEVTYHLGVAPAVVVGLIKQRERRYFFTLSYMDEAGVTQAAVFEVAKDAPRSLLPVFAARATKACVVSQKYQPCPAVPVRMGTNQARP